MSAALEKARICGIICAGILLKGKIKRLCRFRAMRGCAIDGLAKMFVQAHIFASWYNSHMMSCGKYRRLRRPCGREPHDVPLTASRKCLCEHTLSLRGIIAFVGCCFAASGGFAPNRACGTDSTFDGRAKMPLQASISANFAKRWIYIHIVRGGASRPHARRAPPPSALRRGE